MDDDVRRLLDAHETQRTAHLHGDAALMRWISVYERVGDDWRLRAISSSVVEVE